jgi:nucleoside-diphosphate-sugar epimerase
MKENDVVAAYLASKKVAEEAAWKFMADNKPSFDLTVLNPHVIIGPMLQPLAGPKNITGTNVFPIYNFLNGAYDKIEGLIFPGWHYVDARDVAKAHILSMTTPAASNKRIILVSGLITPQLVINAIRKNFPELHDRVIEGHPEILMPDGIDPTHWDASRSHEIFGPEWKYIDVETSVTDTVRNMLEHEKRWAAAGQ